MKKQILKETKAVSQRFKSVSFYFALVIIFVISLFILKILYKKICRIREQAANKRKKFNEYKEKFLRKITELHGETGSCVTEINKNIDKEDKVVAFAALKEAEDEYKRRSLKKSFKDYKKEWDDLIDIYSSCKINIINALSDEKKLDKEFLIFQFIALEKNASHFESFVDEIRKEDSLKKEEKKIFNQEANKINDIAIDVKNFAVEHEQIEEEEKLKNEIEKKKRFLSKQYKMIAKFLKKRVK